MSIGYQRLKALLRTSKIESKRPRHTVGILGEIAGWAGRIVDVGSLNPGEQIVELDRAEHHVLEELADFEMRRL